MFKSHSFIFIILALVQAKHRSDVEDIDKKINDRIEKENENFVDSERRFMDDLNDHEWHIAHLRATDFENTRRTGQNCKEETFTEKVKRYRKSLKEDAGRITFVSADPLPVDDKDLDEYKCIPNDTKHEVTNPNKESKPTNKEGPVTKPDAEVVKTKKPDIAEKVTPTELPITEATVEVEGKVTLDDANASLQPIDNIKVPLEIPIVHQATTMKHNSDEEKNKDARRGDYLFSSIEYDDDVVDFSPDSCPPDVVEVIELELDILRPYDVECELSVEWQSLEEETVIY